MNNGLVILLNDQPDSLIFEGSDLIKSLKKRNYSILLPNHPGDIFTEKVALNSREARLDDLTKLIQKHDTSGGKQLVIIGFGEGAYLTPALANITSASRSFIVNAGPYSLIDEYSAFLSLALPDTNTLALLLNSNNLNDQKELQEKVQAIIDGDPGFDKLSNGTDFYFRDYQANPMMLELMKSEQPMYWIISKDYPLVSKESRAFSEELAASLHNVHLVELEGLGNLNNSQEMKQLTEIIESLISSD